MRLAALTWRRRLAAVALALLAGESAFAKGGATFVGQAGDVELGVGGLYDLDTSDDTAAYLDLRLGYFLLDSIEIGVTMLNGTTREGERDRNGIFGEYNFVIGRQLTPFAGLGLEHAAPPVDSEDGKDARVMALFGGAKFLLTGSAALAVTMALEFATEPVLGPTGARKKSNKDIDLSFRLFL